MKQATPVSTIASFAVLKTLNDAKTYRSPYQLLGNFISYVIDFDKLYTFESSEIRLKLQEYFGFNVPEVVIKSSLKTLKYVSKNNNTYSVDMSGHSNKGQLGSLKIEAESKYARIVDDIIEFIKETCPNINKEKVVRAIVAYLVSDTSTSEYREEISKFIVSKEKDEEIQKFLNAVREGAILYLGINHNISEQGSLKYELTLYLDTEILFDLLGYNGSVYEIFAKDFYSLVQKGKRKGKIMLKYFPHVKSEIERYFKSAERIVDGTSYFDDEKPAMKHIVNGSQTSADVRVKKADFFSKLQSMSVLEDETSNFDSDEFYRYNIDYSECSSEREIEGWKAINCINKLRRGQIYDFELDSHFIIVTDSRNVLEISNEQSNRDRKCHNRRHSAQYAVALNCATNLLWYKLDGGFGGEKFPSNTALLLRSRIVLSESITKQINDLFKANREHYLKGEISQEQFVARVLALREKPTLPEEISKDNIEDAFDFSPPMIARLEVEIQSHRQYRSEQEKVVKALHAENQAILASKEAELKEKDSLIEKQSAELCAFREKEKAHAIRKERVRKILCVAGKIVVVAIIIGVEYYAKFHCDNLDKWIGLTIDGVSLIGFCLVCAKWLLHIGRLLKRLIRKSN